MGLEEEGLIYFQHSGGAGRAFKQESPERAVRLGLEDNGGGLLGDVGGRARAAAEGGQVNETIAAETLRNRGLVVWAG